MESSHIFSTTAVKRGTVRACALAGAALSVLALTAAAPSGASAQQVAEANLEEIVVTGSLIKGNPDVASTNPITVVGTEEIQRENSLNIQTLLAKLPAVGTQGSTAAVSSNNGSYGTNYIDLRNLSPQRTLVLIDGQRMVGTAISGASSAVDLNNIPTDLIDHIELLRDGASPIYGSDAVAGVVNFVMKKNFSGLQFNTQDGISSHGDGQERSIDVVAGDSFNRGSFVIFAGYDKTDPVWQRDRAWAVSNINGSGNSSYWLNGHYVDDATGGSQVNLLGNGVGGFSPFPGGKFDTKIIPNLIAGSEHKSFNGNLTYNIFESNDNPVNFVASVLFVDRNSTGTANPDPNFVQTTAGTLGISSVPAGTVIDAFGRWSALGNRVFTGDVQTYRFVVGFEGTLFGKYDWEVKYNDGVSHGNNDTAGLMNQQNAGEIAGTTYTAFNLNNLGAAGVANLQINPEEVLRTEERQISAQLSGPVFKLPAGDITAALGGDHRTETLTDTPDSAEILGIVDQGGNATAGSYSLSEVFAEANIPILKDQFLIKDLSLDAAVRYSDYSNFGSTTTWKATGNWAPTEDLRFRSTLGTSFRAPTVQELYLANSQNYVGVSDPCDTNPNSGSLRTSASGQKLANVIANCAASLGALGINPNSFSPYANAQQILGIGGGNPNLKPESARSFTFGSVLTPHWVPNLEVTVDFFRTNLENQIIQQPDPQTLLNTCYGSPNLSNGQCAQINARVTTPTSAQPTVGGISKLILTSLNSGVIHTDGVDFGLNYHYNMSNFGVPELGKLVFSHVSTYTLNYLQSDQTGALNTYTGKILPTTLQGGGYPVYQAHMSLGLEAEDWTFTWSTRFIEGLTLYHSAGSAVPDPTVYGNTTPDVWYHDISASYNVYKGTRLYLGVQNLFDRNPPYFPDAIARTDSNPYIYDYMGRYLYTRLSVKF